MARSVGGSTWPNNGEEWDIETLIRTGGAQGTTTFIHPAIVRDPWLWSAPSNDNLGIYLKVREGYPPQGLDAYPQQAIHIRFYDRFDVHAGLAESDPASWAARVVAMLAEQTYDYFAGYDRKGNALHATRTVNLLDDPFVVVSAYNEVNLEYGIYMNRKPNAATYWEWAEREVAFWDEFDRLAPRRRCLTASSAPAAGHDAFPDDPDSEWAVIENAGLLNAVDVVQVHTYAERNTQPQSGPDGADAYWYALRPFRSKGYRENVQGQTGRPADRGGVVSQFGGRYRYFISEWNNFVCDREDMEIVTCRDFDAMEDAFAECPWLVGATSFIWRGGPHNMNVIARKDGRGNPRPLLAWHMMKAGRHPHSSADWPTARWQDQEPTRPPDPDVPKPEPEEPMSEYVVGPGVLATLAAEGDMPASHEAYIGEGLSLTVGASGQLYVYTPRTGVVVYSPKESPDHR